MIEESAAAYEGRGARLGYLLAAMYLVVVEAHLGRYAQARETGQTCLAYCRQAGWRWGSALCLGMLGMVALGVREAEEARQFLEESVRVFQEVVVRPWESWILAFPGCAAHALGRLPEAGQCFCRAIQMAFEIKSLLSLLYTLPGVASLLADLGEVKRAVELYALATRYPFVANSRWFEDVAGKHIAAAAQALPPDVIAAAQERGRTRDLEAMVRELLNKTDGLLSG